MPLAASAGAMRLVTFLIRALSSTSVRGTRLDPRGREEVLDRLDQALDLLVDDGEALAVGRRQTGTAGEQLQVKRDGVEGRPDFVRHRRGEVSHGGELLGAAELPGEIEEQFVRSLKRLVALGQHLRRLVDAPLEVLVEPMDLVQETGVLLLALPDSAQHARVSGGELAHLVVAREAGHFGEIAAFHGGHRREGEPDGSVQAALDEERECDNAGDAGHQQRNQELFLEAHRQPTCPLDGKR